MLTSPYNLCIISVPIHGRGLLRDCEIFGILRITFVSSCTEDYKLLLSVCTAKMSAQQSDRQRISDYDDFVAEVGEFGLWQKLLCSLLWIPAAAGGIHVLMYSFTGLSPSNYRS